MNPSLTYVRGSYGAFRATVSATSIAQGLHALRCYFAAPLERLEAWDSERKDWVLIHRQHAAAPAVRRRDSFESAKLTTGEFNEP